MRSHETKTRLAVPPEAVWKAITDPEEIQRWFAPYASLKPGPDGGMTGGSYSVGWVPDAQGTMVVEVWEPNRRLRLSDERVAVEYILEAEDGFTTLRLVHSGFGEGAEWDGEYEGSKKGWPVFFRILKHNLEQHSGEPVRQISITLTVDANPDQQWDRLLGSEMAKLNAGDRFSFKIPGADTIDGVVDFTDHKHLFGGVVENWNRALLTVFCETCQGKGMLSVMLGMYGPLVAQAEEVEQRWKAGLEGLFSSSKTAAT